MLVYKKPSTTATKLRFVEINRNTFDRVRLEPIISDQQHISKTPALTQLRDGFFNNLCRTCGHSHTRTGEGRIYIAVPAATLDISC